MKFEGPRNITNKILTGIAVAGTFIPAIGQKTQIPETPKEKTETIRKDTTAQNIDSSTVKNITQEDILKSQQTKEDSIKKTNIEIDFSGRENLEIPIELFTKVDYIRMSFGRYQEGASAIPDPDGKTYTIALRITDTEDSFIVLKNVSADIVTKLLSKSTSYGEDKFFADIEDETSARKYKIYKSDEFLQGLIPKDLSKKDLENAIGHKNRKDLPKIGVLLFQEHFNFN
ncbi:MAG: hypothetical protein KBD52_03110 [Candidatus Pacebacteria bacterium]|nr:hypothetical protein [Candidatus Paceibacterota bacterium]